MNYVAHLYLTHPKRELSVGNLLGDILSHRLVDELGPTYRYGITIHRFIDSYTDNDTSLNQARSLLRRRHRKYAPVVLDLLLDYILVDEWASYAEMSFESFQDWVYDAIGSTSHRIPQSAGIRLQHMAHGRWLNSYTSIGRFEKVLERMDRRARFESHFSEAIHDLNEFGDVLSQSLGEILGKLKPEVDAMMTGFTPRNEGKS